MGAIRKGFYREKAFCDRGWVLTFDDVICLPGYTAFSPSEVSIKSSIGPFQFNLPFISASMDTVTESEMAIQMALNGGLGVIHRNCSLSRQLEMVKRVKRARSFVVQDVATTHPDTSIHNAILKMHSHDISGLVVVDDQNHVVGILTKRDLPFTEEYTGSVSDYMTPDPVCLPAGASREDALNRLYEIRKEKIPLVDEDHRLVGLITLVDLKPNFPHAVKDGKGRLLVGLGTGPTLPASTEGIELKREIAEYTDLFFTDVAEFWKEADIMGVKTQMEVLQTPFVLGNIGTYEAAEDLLTRDFPEEMFVGIKVGMGSGSICSTTIQTGVGAPTLFATAQVADAIADYNSKIALIADGGFKYPGDVVKSLAVGADMIMSGHFFAGCTESPGYVDEISGRKVKVYRGMGSAEARSVGSYAEDRYVPNQKKLVEGVSGYIPFTGPVGGKLESLGDSLRNGLIYAGAADMVQAKAIRIGRVTYSGQAESAPHDLIGRT